jgi:HD-GYP domain-containing protein (c-di-GMP phosphodiesterase class II)
MSHNTQNSKQYNQKIKFPEQVAQPTQITKRNSRPAARSNVSQGRKYRRANFIAVLEQANHIASMTSLEELLEKMLDLIISVSSATNGTLYLLDRAAGELVFMVVKGNKEDEKLIGRRIPKDTGIVGASIAQAKPIVIDDIENDPRWYKDIIPDKSSNLKNVITFPLLLQGKAIGAVQIFNFVQNELELLQLLGNRMASEVDKVLLLERSTQSNQRLQALVNMLGQIGAILDKEKLLNVLTDLSSKLLNAERSSVFLADANNDQTPLMVSRTSTAALKEKPEIQRHRYTYNPNLSALDQSFHARSAVAAPLRARPITLGKERKFSDTRVIGNLMAMNKQNGNFDSDDTQLLEILATQASTVLQIADLYNEANELFLDFIKVLAAAIDAKDPYTRGHSQRVSDLSVAIAQVLALSADQIHSIRIGSLLHDIGKIGMPDSILAKPNKLTENEYEQIKKHPGIGYKIMNQVRLLNNVLPAIIEHHERLDGTGYPLGLEGDQISIAGRIVAVADVFDALTTDRPYRQAYSSDKAIAHLEQNSGTQFDGTCVTALRKVIHS